jgi:hypothetical protein
LTIERICARAACIALLEVGAVVGSSVRVGAVVTTGVVGAAVVRVGVGAVVGRVAVRGGVTLGLAVAVRPEGVPAGGEPAVVVDGADAGEVVPPSAEGMSLPGWEGPAPSAWAPLVPPSPYVRPSVSPDSSPEDTATAPTAIAADEASSPVRTGWCLRRPR